MGNAEQELLRRYVADGDAEAFRTLVEAHEGMVYAVCRRVLGNDADAADVVQASFLQLARKAASLRAPIAGWLYGVALQLARNLRRDNKTRRVHETRAARIRSTETDATWDDVQDLLDDAIADLPESVRTSVILHFLEGRGQAEVAAQLSLSQSAVSKRIAKGLERMRHHMARQGVIISGIALATLLSAHAAQAAPATLAVATIGKLALAGLTTGAKTAHAATIGGMTVAKLAALSAVAASVMIAGGVVVYNAISADKPAAQPPAQVAVAPAQIPPDHMRIDGIVVDEQGRPMGGVAVKSWQVPATITTTQSGADGQFILDVDPPIIGPTLLLAADADESHMGLENLQTDGFPAPPPVRIVLKPSRTVKVTVEDSQHRPVPGATVQAMQLVGATTDAKGTAVLRVPVDQRPGSIVGFKAGVGLDYFENYKTWPPPAALPDLPAQVTLVLQGGRSVRLHAVDSADKPVRDIVIIAASIHKRDRLAYVSVFDRSAAITNAEGVATIDWLPADLKSVVSCHVFDKRYHCPNQPETKATDPVTDLTFRVFRITPVAGKVLLPDGQPAPGVMLQFEGRGNDHWPCRKKARTGADGTYSVLLAPNQSYIAAVTDDRWASPPRTGLLVREDQSWKNVDFQLVPGTLIHGKVTDGPDGKPVADKTIRLSLQGGELPDDLRPEYGQKTEYFSRWATSKADGTYSIRVGPGSYRLSCEGLPDRQEDLKIGTEKEIVRNFVAGDPDAGAQEIRGTVTHEGKPMADAMVEWRSQSIIRTDAQGRFSFKYRWEKWEELEGGRMLIHVRNTEGTLHGMVAVQKDENDVLILLFPPASLRGRVVDEQGAPAAGRSIRLSAVAETNFGGSTQLPWSEARTDPDGRFEIAGLAIGKGAKYDIKVETGEDMEVKGTTRFDAPEPKTIELGNLIIVAKPKLSGVVMDAVQKDWPVANAAVRIGDAVEREGGRMFGRSGEAKADATGAFAAYGVTGHLLIYATNQDGSQAGLTEIMADEPHEKLQVQLGLAGSATGGLLNADGKPLVRLDILCLVQPNGRNGNPLGAWDITSAQTDLEGRFTIRGLPVGLEYSLCISTPGVGMTDIATFPVTEAKPLDLGDITIPKEKLNQ
jgi:RNA polymerase sigma factor (sigma-70 family)